MELSNRDALGTFAKLLDLGFDLGAYAVAHFSLISDAR
jgi:hypothetical protein